MEMETSYYLIRPRPELVDYLTRQTSESGTGLDDYPGQELEGPILVSITQGGFGQDIVDDERQVKERFLEHLFRSRGIDLPRSAGAFDSYFQLETVEEIIDLDEDT